MAVETTIAHYRARVEQALEQRLPAAAIHPGRLHQAMRYAVLGGGKRIRPILVYAAGATVGVAMDLLDAPACAVELIHAYSLIHDDLPAMDNDELRHGKPTCHRAFDEATALLAGDALQTLAFQALAEDTAGAPDAAARLRAVAMLAQAAGSRGMAGGQAIDLAAVGQELTLAELEDMHIHKTGALIRASVLLGAMRRPPLADDSLDRLDRYAKCIGLAFQIRDDILDVIGDAGALGKTQGMDAQRRKPTYPTLLGLEGAHSRAIELIDAALNSLAPFGPEADVLRWIAAYIVERSY